ncbi:TlpA family protein disulfide reductase [Sunxiuqinia sp. A32]|uniref:TlpA family protein disulfide reductase n=1 Tax=Sunxiuqinia sp. A32 TaxID=3461496 RepID=UPI004045492A
MKIKFITIFLTILFNTSFSAQVKISGKAPDYAGYEILLYSYADPISDEKIELCTFQISPDGTFSKQIEIKNVTQAIADFDSYSANIYLVPGENYEILLPPVKKVTESQKRNPFFRLETIHLATKDADEKELNRMIRQFEQAFQQTEAQYFNEIYDSKSSYITDTVKGILDKEFPPGKNSFFEEYRFYRMGFLEFARHQGRSDNFVTNYFVKHQPNYKIAPCKDLFNRLFSDEFSQLVNSIDGSEFRQVIGTNDPEAIAGYLMNKNGFNLELAQMIILKSIKDAFYQGQFSQKSLLSLLDKIQSGKWDSEKKEIALRLKSQLTYMLPGTPAPALSFTDFNGKTHQLSDFSDQLVYLHFTRVANPICRQHLDELKKLPPAVLQEVKIFNLILPDELQKKDPIVKQNWPGEFMIVSEKAAANWQVKSFPTAYLIDENGKLIYSPANTPLEGLGRQIGTLLQKRHIENLRNQSK